MFLSQMGSDFSTPWFRTIEVWASCEVESTIPWRKERVGDEIASQSVSGWLARSVEGTSDALSSVHILVSINTSYRDVERGVGKYWHTLCAGPYSGQALMWRAKTLGYGVWGQW